MAALLKEGKTQAYIAAELGRSEATISREINRNSGREAHDPNQAQGNFENRRKACRRPAQARRPGAQCTGQAPECCWSPEQIQYRLLHENSGYSISYATIYRAIHASRFNNPDWVKSGKQRLRHRGKKRLRKGESAHDGFPVSNALSKRPAEAQTRERIGDREADTVAGVTGGAVLLTNRKIRFLFLCAPGEEDGERGKRGGDGGVGSRILLPAPVPAVGAWDE